MNESLDSPDDALARPPHVVPDILAYLDQTLPPTTRSTVEGHLAGCEECRAQLDFARRLHGDVIAQSARHVAPERLVALGEGRLDALASNEESHLANCADCREELVWARSAPPMPVAEEAAPSGSAGVTRVRPHGGLASMWPAWAFGILVVAATVLTILVIRPNMEMRGSVASLAILQPLATAQDTRGDNPNASTRRQAIAAYAAKDYRQAEALLITEVKARSADAEALLLLGSSLLLSGRPAESREPLQAAGRLAPSARLREEALWQQAQASLLLGRRVEASAFLQEVADTGTTHQDEARAQLAKLAELAPLR